MGMRRVAHAKPVHKLPPHLPPVQSRMDVYGDPAGQPEPVGKSGQGPVPAVQGPRGDGGEEREISAGMVNLLSVPRGFTGRTGEKAWRLSRVLHKPARGEGLPVRSSCAGRKYGRI